MDRVTGLPPAPDAERRALDFAAAIATEHKYFELAAEVERLPGAALAWMPGLAACPAAAVIHRAEPAAIAAAGSEWVEDAERAFVSVGARLARIYVDAGTAADAVLRRAGYAARDELVFVDRPPVPTAGLVLRPVESDGDWARKLRLHQAVGDFPDGHFTSPAEWVALERRKCAAGMRAFLAELDGETVGAVGAIDGSDGILRLKNLVVHPALRRQGVGLAMLAQGAALGRERGFDRLCVLAVRGEAGEQLYRAAEMRVAGVQVEWSKALGAGGR